MNQGLYGFPSTLGIAAANIISITEFDVTGTYSIPRNATSLEILLIGAGGGGAGGAGGNGTNACGGGAGSGGSIIYVDCLVVDDLPSSTLNVTIGTGGQGGSNGVSGTGVRQATNGGPGGNSSVSMAGFPGLFIRAQGGAGGSAAGNAITPNANGTVAVGGAGKISTIRFVQATNSSGQNGGSTATAMPSVVILDARNNNGAGGGSALGAASATTGGSIEISTNLTATNSPILYHINLPLVGTALGITAALGGRINSGATLGAGQNGSYMIGTSLKSFGGGIGGAGGGGSFNATFGGGNGGNGYRGGGGGGGGGSRTNNIPGGTGGIGGNGYCCIISRA